MTEAILEFYAMSYDFTGVAGTEWGTNAQGWRLILHLAERFGWQPAGTTPPDDLPAGLRWEGNYFGNEGQRVADEDAVALAAALRKAVLSAEFDVLLAEFWADYGKQLAAYSTPTVKLSAQGQMRPDKGRLLLIEFAANCEQGSFTIH